MLNSTVVNLIESILNGSIKPRSCVINPCNICNKTVKNKQKGILCDTCDGGFILAVMGLQKMNMRYSNLVVVCMLSL